MWGVGSSALPKPGGRAEALAPLALLVACPVFAALMPLPARLTTGAGRLAITQNFAVSLTGASDPRLTAESARFLGQIAKRTGMPLAPDGEHPVLIVSCASAGNAVQTLDEDESYQLEISPSQATLKAPNPLGVLRGFATFLQLIEPGDGGFSAPAVSIDDHPRFRWRGLHIDASRHWMPVEIIERNLDGMAAVKLNVLHWHLSDNQGFRVESKRYPKLHGKGSDGLYYTQDQVRAVIAYARQRGIRVVPEFDIPGHSTSWIVAYPELTDAPGPFEIGRTWGIFDPVMDPTREFVYNFLDGFIGEMAALFPDQYFHIGGDEVNGREWNSSTSITAFKRAHGMLTAANPTREQLRQSNEKLQAYFNQRVLPIVKKHGKTMMGWDEILAPELPKDIVIQSWRGQQSLADAVRQGFQGVLSAGYYLDLAQPASMHYAVDPLIDPKTQKPLDLTAEQRERILGGEACMWTEYVSTENVDSRIWPRTAAIAERLWSVTPDAESMYARLEVVSRDLDFYGLTHRSSYAVMLERLAGEHDPAPLRVLADVVEPVKGYARARGRKYTQQTPLNRLVDTARPESDAARHFAALVEAKDWAPVRRQLTVWRENAGALDRVIAGSPLLAEVAPAARDLAAVAGVGLEALDFLEKGTKPPPVWVQARSAALAEAKKPRAELLLMVVGPVQKIVDLTQ